MSMLLSRLSQFSFTRFLMSGGVNTALTYAIYIFLLMVVPYQVSYTIAYVLGIFLAYALNRFFVFKSHRGVRSVVLFPLVYLVQYLTAMLTLWVWIEQLGKSEKVAPLIAIIITVPITYLLSRFIFLPKSCKP
jgi:putative flippase GtrA